MDSEDDIFLNALELPDPAQRAAYLAQACNADAALRKRVEDLLRDAAGAQDFFGAEDNLPRIPAPALTEGPGTAIGRYKLLEKIGEGGMGVVYMAEQREPVVRKIALKIIKVGMDTRQVLGRFEAERQALALMDHPNIARILDGGATGRGRPYFVMDLVQGLPITRFCDEANLSIQERMDLLLDVCSAVQHAHQKGIIHRDIKPANILVMLHGDKPVPKVIDFGIAKATEGRLTENTLLTQFQHFLGTPAYMSPEQAGLRGLDVDTRSDIYALGVLLYELLTGKTPFDEKELMKAGIDEMRRTIQEREPLRPSTRLSTLASEELTATAQHRRIEANRLISTLRGDLDWIVMKCLEKDRVRRYDTANGLASDLQRHLSNEPVTARPPSAVYRFQKALRRNKLIYAAGSAVALTLIAGLSFSTWSFLRERKANASEAAQRRIAVEERSKAEAGELAARQKAYASDMNLVQRALEMNNMGSAMNLLNRYRPGTNSEIQKSKSAKEDLRGWEWRYLWSRCQSDAESVFFKSTNDIVSLSVSHDGAWLALGLSNTGVSIRDQATRREIARLPASGEVVRVAFSPRELLLAFSDVPSFGSSSTNYSIHLWDGVSQRTVRTLPLGYYCYGVAFSEDGKILVTSTQNFGNNSDLPGMITLWRVSDGTIAKSYPAPQYGTMDGTSFALARDLSVAAHQTEDNKVRVIDLATGRQLWEPRKATDDYVLALALSPNAKILASGPGFADSVIRLWDVPSGRELGKLEGHREGIEELLFFPNGHILASASRDQTIRLWDVTDPAHGQLLSILQGHRSWVRTLTLLPDNTTLASGSADRTVCLWNTATPRQKKKQFTLPTSIGPWRFTPDGKSIVALYDQVRGDRLARWSLDTDFQKMELLLELGTNRIDEACFSRDGRWLATSNPGGQVQVWDLQTRGRTCEFNAHVQRALPREFIAEGKKLLLTDAADNSLREWDLTRLQQTRAWPSVPGRWTYALSPDANWYLTSILNPDTRTVTSLTELSSGRQIDLHLPWCIAASFSPDGKLFALGGWGNDVRLFETATIKEIVRLSGTFGDVRGVAFSPDGRRFVAGGEGTETVTVWNTETHEKILTLESPGSLFDTLAFSPDGNLLAASNWRGVLHLWRAPTWAEIEAAEKVQTR